MSKFARSARGEIVDFDLLAIKQQLAMTPVPVSVDDRRKFIDERDGLKTKQSQTVSSEPETQEPAIPSALLMAVAAAAESAAAADDEPSEES